MNKQWKQAYRQAAENQSIPPEIKERMKTRRIITYVAVLATIAVVLGVCVANIDSGDGGKPNVRHALDDELFEIIEDLEDVFYQDVGKASSLRSDGRLISYHDMEESLVVGAKRLAYSTGVFLGGYPNSRHYPEVERKFTRLCELTGMIYDEIDDMAKEVLRIRDK